MVRGWCVYLWYGGLVVCVGVVVFGEVWWRDEFVVVLLECGVVGGDCCEIVDIVLCSGGGCVCEGGCGGFE